MAAFPKRISWDACIWIALIQKEKILDGSGAVIEDRYALARSVIELAERGKIEIAISGLCLAEVVKNPPGETATDDKVGPYFDQDYILVVPVDTEVGTAARRLMRAGHRGLKPPDSVHLATAMVANVDEMHTFDAKLLSFDGALNKSDGTALKICKPTHGGPQLPLMEAAEKQPPEAAEVPQDTMEPQRVDALEDELTAVFAKILAASADGAALADLAEPPKADAEEPSAPHSESVEEIDPAAEVSIAPAAIPDDQDA